MYLPDEARFAHLLTLPEGANLGKAINDAMARSKREPGSGGRAAADYNRLRTPRWSRCCASLAPLDLEGDAFGKIYEYFLGKFAMTEGQKGGEFFTPTASSS